MHASANHVDEKGARDDACALSRDARDDGRARRVDEGSPLELVLSRKRCRLASRRGEDARATERD